MTQPVDRAVGPALDAMIADLSSASAWLDEIETERRQARRRIEELRAAIRATVQLLPEVERDRRLSEISDAVPAAARPGPPIGRTERMAAVMHVLATHPTGTIRTGELQHYLSANALARDSRAAGRALGKKAKQGIVTRLDWGTYRINVDHPELVKVRRGMVQA